MDCRTAITWTLEGRRKWGSPRTTWRRTVERERAKAGWKIRVRYKLTRLTELVGGVVIRPYVPHGAKQIGNR